MTHAKHSVMLITGGLGFIGVNFIDFMLKKGRTSFRILDNLSVGTFENLETVLAEHGWFEKTTKGNRVAYSLARLCGPAVIEVLVGDIRAPDDCLRASSDAGAVVHLAAQSGVPTSVADPVHDCVTNVVGTLNMLEACRKNGVESFVFASSGAPLGEVEPPIHEKKLPRPISPYGVSKLAGEAYCHAYHKTFNLKTASLRFGNVYGPRSSHKTSVVAKFLKRARQGQPLEIYGDGTQTRDFIYTEDLCNAIFLCLEALAASGSDGSDAAAGPDAATRDSALPVAGEIFQIATFRETTVNEIAHKIRDIAGNGSDKKIEIRYGEKRLGDVKRNFSDTSKAHQRLGFTPMFNLDQGLLATWQHELGATIGNPTARWESARHVEKPADTMDPLVAQERQSRRS